MSEFARILAVILISGAIGAAGCVEQGDIASRYTQQFAPPLGEFQDHPAISGPISPIPTYTNTNTALIELGKVLFHDKRLSSDSSVSCASCHVINEGGDDGRPVSVGVDGRMGSHNAPTVLNAGLNFAQFWDGRADSLVAQIDGPITNHLEMDSDWDTIVSVLQADRATRQTFQAAGFSKITPQAIRHAIAVYEFALVTPNGPFDQFLRGDADALSDTQKQGYRLFNDLGCVSCHQGRNVGGNMFQRFGVYENYYALDGTPSKTSYGRYNLTGLEEDRHVFKVPSLRNVTRTAPYFHDGSVATLDEAISIMARYQLGIDLSEDERHAIMAFLTSLDGELDEVLL